MKISIVIPSYEQATYITKCVDSLLKQRDVNLEILIFDSLSSDKTLEELEKYGTKIKVVSEKDLGQSHAINKGLMNSSGEILGYLNSDDVLLPDALRSVVEAWLADPSLDLLYGKAKIINEKDFVKGKYKTYSWDWKRIKGECYICQPAAFWSRRIMNKIGFFDQSLKCSLDYDYWLRIVGAGGRVSYFEKYLACSRDYSTTKTRRLRSTVFIENFKISLSRIGVIDAFWICQYLDYFKYEKKPKWSIVIPPRGKARDFVTRLLSIASGSLAKDVTFKEVRPKVVY